MNKFTFLILYFSFSYQIKIIKVFYHEVCTEIIEHFFLNIREENP